jgi:TonB family protein
MKSVMLSAILFTACATTGTPTLDRETHTGSRVQLDLVPHADATRVFPQAIDPRLPTADRVAHQIRAELGDSASIEVKLCVAPEGTVASVEVLRGSTMSVFDQSVIADAMRWQFAALPGPDSVRTCERATITYRPHA